MLRLGKFTEAIERGDERRSSLRKENAGLYADFVRDNPGASIDERTDYAQTLINDTGVGSRGLPTRAAMQKSVDTYKKAEATKAAAAARAAESRKQAAIRQRFTDVESIMANAAAMGQDKAYVEGLLTEFGYELDGIDAIMTGVKDKQFQEWQKDNEAAIQSYLESPTKAGYDLLLSRGGDFKENITTLFKSQYEASEETQSKELKIALEVLASATDQADYDRQLRDLRNKYPDAVFNKVKSEVSLTEGLFEGNMKTKLAEEVVTARAKLEELSNEDSTPQDYERKRDQFLLTLSEDVRAEVSKGGDGSIVNGYGANFDRQMGLRTDASVQKLRGELSDLSRQNLAPDDYKVERKELLALYPQAVQDGAAEFVTQANTNFKETTSERLEAEVARLTSELDVLTMRTDITPELYKEMLANKLAQYSTEAQAAAQAAIAEDKANFTERDAARTAKTKETFSSEALFNLNKLVMEPATTQEALTARINKDKRDATALGFKLGETFGDDAQAKFDEKKAERDKNEEARVTSLVNSQTEAALNAAINDTSFEAVRTKLEADLSANEGRNVVLNTQQIKLLQAQFDKGQSQLQANMTDLATGQVKDITQYASAVAQSKKEFVDSFVIQMQAGSNGGVANARMRFGTLAEETYDNIISAIREQNNQIEVEKIRKAVTEMNASRDNVTLSDAVKANKALLENPTIIGTANKDEIPGIVADISQDLLVKATRMASELDIPLTEEVYEQMVLNLANGEHVPGQKFDPNLIRASLLNAFGATVDNAPNGGLERMAFQEALEAVGHDMLSLSQATPAEFRAFGQEFKKARTQMATETYDIFGSSFAEDVERSTPLVQDATKVSVDNDPKIAEALALMEPLLSLSVDGYIAADPPIDVINEAATSIGNLVPTLAASIEDIDTELRRLDALSRTSIYKTSEHAQSVTERIQQLTALRNANQNTISQIEYAQEKYKELAAKDLADRDQAYNDYELEQAMAQYNAAKLSGEPINPRDFPEIIREQIRADQAAAQQDQRDNNSSLFNRYILGDRWRTD